MIMKMKHNILTSLAVLAFAAAACTEPEYGPKEGTLSFENLSVTTDDAVVTKTITDAPRSFAITINDSHGSEFLTTTIGNCSGGVTLPADSYTMIASSYADDPVPAAFDSPYYKGEASFVISPGRTTYVGDIVCTLQQCVVSVGYTNEFLAAVTGDCAVTVSVTSGTPLVYDLNYNGGNISYETRPGYFTVNNGSNTTMEVSFKGNVEGKEQKMTKSFTGIAVQQWRSVTFTRKVEGDGNATFDIIINDYVEDEDLDNFFATTETIIGDDPSGPTDDGGITLESTCSYSIDSPIDVPSLGHPFVLTMKATIPNGVKKFSVEIKSTSEAFVGSVGAINDGQTVLDLVNPSSGAEQVFTSILPFPYGDDVYGKSEIYFNLSDAQEPIFAFPGEHTFVMHVVDQKGCRKDISIVLNVR